MRRLPVVWLLLGLAVVALLIAAAVGPSVILRVDIGNRAGQLSAAETAAAVNQIRSTILSTLGAVVVLAGAYVGWRQLQHSVQATQMQVELQRQGAVTDRYTRAVDQLASVDPTIRVGAIHALNRIGEEAVAERPGIVALLATYIRHHAALPTDSPGTDSMRTADADLPLRSRAPDVQAALTTLCRWISVGESPPEWLTADLSHTNLRNGNLNQASLWHVRLYGADLTGANLARADLRGADFSGALLHGADLTAARADDTTWWPDGFDPQVYGVNGDPGSVWVKEAMK